MDPYYHKAMWMLDMDVSMINLDLFNSAIFKLQSSGKIKKYCGRGGMKNSIIVHADGIWDQLQCDELRAILPRLKVFMAG